MRVTTKELRIQPGKIIAQVSRGQSITVTFRGKDFAKIVPLIESKGDALVGEANPLFGMWKDHKETGNVDAYVRSRRKGRAL